METHENRTFSKCKVKVNPATKGILRSFNSNTTQLLNLNDIFLKCLVVVDLSSDLQGLNIKLNIVQAHLGHKGEVQITITAISADINSSVHQLTVSVFILFKMFLPAAPNLLLSLCGKGMRKGRELLEQSHIPKQNLMETEV